MGELDEKIVEYSMEEEYNLGWNDYLRGISNPPKDEYSFAYSAGWYDSMESTR